MEDFVFVFGKALERYKKKLNSTFILYTQIYKCTGYPNIFNYLFIYLLLKKLLKNNKIVFFQILTVLKYNF